MMSFETQSMANGKSARTSRKTMLASTRGGLVSHTILSNGIMYLSDARRTRQESSTAGCVGLAWRMREF
jgi:hypothetical protein